MCLVRSGYVLNVYKESPKLPLKSLEMDSYHLRRRLNSVVLGQDGREMREWLIVCPDKILIPESDFLHKSIDAVAEHENVCIFALQTDIQIVKLHKDVTEVCQQMHVIIITKKVHKFLFVAVNCMYTYLVSEFKESFKDFSS